MHGHGWLLLITLLAPAGSPHPAFADPTASLFTPGWQFTDDHGKAVTLDRWPSDHLVVTMGYVACVARCPHTIDRLKEIGAAATRRGSPLQIVFVTLDPLRDTPKRLHDYKVRRGLSDETWHLLRADKKTTAALAHSLGIRAAGDDAHIDHNARVVVLDRAGTPVRAIEGWQFDEHTLLGD